MAILLYVDISMTVVYIITGVLGFIGFIGPWILVLTQHYKAYDKKIHFVYVDILIGKSQVHGMKLG